MLKMNLLRTSLRVSLILALCVVSPGGSAWAAIGRAVTPVAPRAAVPAIPTGSMNLRLGANVTPLAFTAPNAGASLLTAPSLKTAGAVAPLSVPAAADAPAAAAPASAVRLAAGPAAAAAAAPLQAALSVAGEQAAAFSAPDKPEAAAKSEADVAFDLSILRTAAADAPRVGANAMRASLTAGLTKKGDQGMPDRYDEQGNPDNNKGGGHRRAACATGP